MTRPFILDLIVSLMLGEEKGDQVLPHAIHRFTVAVTPFVGSAVNFFMNAILICYGCPQIHKLCYTFEGFSSCFYVVIFFIHSVRGTWKSICLRIILVSWLATNSVPVSVQYVCFHAVKSVSSAVIEVLRCFSLFSPKIVPFMKSCGKIW